VGELKSPPSLCQFFGCVRRVAALYSAGVISVWQWKKIIQSYPASRCWSGSPPKSNHL